MINKRQKIFFVVGICFLQACTTTSENGGPVTNTAVNRAIGKCAASIAVSTIGGAIIGAAFGGNDSAKEGAVIGAAVGIGHCAILLNLAAKEDKLQLQQAQVRALETDQTTTQSIQTKSGKTANVTTKVYAAPIPEIKKKKIKKVVKEEPVKAKPIETAEVNSEPKINPATNNDGQVIVNGNIQNTQSQPSESQPEINASNQEDNANETEFLAQAETEVVCRYTELVIDMDGSSTSTDKQKWCRSKDGSWEPVVG